MDGDKAAEPHCMAKPQTLLSAQLILVEKKMEKKKSIIDSYLKKKKYRNQVLFLSSVLRQHNVRVSML